MLGVGLPVHVLRGFGAAIEHRARIVMRHEPSSMPISPHVFRKLQEVLGMDAASELSNIVETVDATRADLAEFRHETRRELDKINTRLDEMATRTDVLNLKMEVKSEIAALRSEFKDALLTQTRWILAGLVTILLAFYFRG